MNCLTKIFIKQQACTEKIFREIVANILIHREYTNAYPSTFIIYKDKVETKNANKPHFIGQLTPGNFKPYPKNPHLAQIYTQMGRSEELGTGVRNVYRYSEAYSGSNKIIFREEDIFIAQIPLKKSIYADININGELNGELNDRQKLVYNKIKVQPGIKATDLSNILHIPFSAIDKYIRFFIKKNLIERKGSKKTGGYYVL